MLEAEAEGGVARVCATCGRRFGEGARFCPFDGEALQIAAEGHSDPLIGTLVDGRYLVESVLGEGGMGTVYRVAHVALSREFALKALRGDLTREGDLAERFLREARSAAAIKHSNVCEITDFGYLPDGRPFFAMELLRGKSLSWWLEKGGPMPVAAGVQVVRQVASVLDAAHQLGIVHRDLKPENVIVNDATSGQGVKVVDFGLAQIAGQSRLTRPGVVFGTPHYMSPEQAMGGTVDHRADIYALGIVMYEMFTGRVPFEADTYMGVLTKHMYVAPTPPSQMLENSKDLGALEDVILRCLNKAPEKRYQRMVDLVAELDWLLTPGQDGGIRIAPKRSRETGGVSQFPRLADELELPSSAEIARNPRFPEAWLSPRLLAGLLLGTLAALGLSLFRTWLSPEPTPLPAQTLALPEAEAPAAAKVTEPVARPEGLAPTPVPDQALAGEKSRSELQAAEAEPSQPVEPKSAQVWSRPKAPRQAAAHREPALSPRPSPEVPEKKPDFSSEELVDPWQN